MSKNEEDNREDEPFTTPGDISEKSTERLESLDLFLFVFLAFSLLLILILAFLFSKNEKSKLLTVVFICQRPVTTMV